MDIKKDLCSGTVWGLIPARLGSSRLNGKALRLLHGLPMVIHVAKRAKLAKYLDRVLICTDSEKILQASIKYGIEACVTSSDCKNGTERIIHAKRLMQIPDNDIIIDIQGDEPLVSPDTIDDVVNTSTNVLGEFDIVLPHQLDALENKKNVVKVVSSGNRVIYLTRSDAPYPFVEDRLLKKHLSVIGFTGASLEKFACIEQGELEKTEGVELLRALEGGMSIFTFPQQVHSFSVDIQEDFERAERVLRTCPLFKKGYA
ncbi:3-deoxy-manno-octulosonate cytidylyltransferase [Chlorobium phaeovibrioides]|uniref:3-deoxy-manno-octulosonate cytidylyltransferase n=1 Tax=Chlorobium phaeovibrioides TaxID=1094 RepID=A0ABW9UTU6_CHLPH|nr:3-deoxy-manno-octulosonate cytidylyltransferase [Chlorobium phaeovibrioides]MWV55154.1 3-deoxy-manno-octulosonate cytidylyltransferase [Chlorobium phaeovibrioides]